MAKVNKQWKLWQTGSLQTVSRNGIQFSTWSLWGFVWCCSIPFQMGFCVTSDSWHAGLRVYITNLPPLHPCWMDLSALSQWRIANTPSTTSNIAGRCPAYIYCIWSPIWKRDNNNDDTVEKYMYIFKTRQISIFSHLVCSPFFNSVPLPSPQLGAVDAEINIHFVHNIITQSCQWFLL